MEKGGDLNQKKGETEKETVNPENTTG